jgi:hypothetical protein
VVSGNFWLDGYSYVWRHANGDLIDDERVHCFGYDGDNGRFWFVFLDCF